MTVNFIEIYDNALDAATCCQIIQKFETSNQIHRGMTGYGVDVAKKDSYDLKITGLPEWLDIERRVLSTTFGYLQKYFRKYLFALVGAISPALFDPQTNQAVTLTQENFAQFESVFMDDVIKHIYRRDFLKVQKYLQGTGGYHHWHSEIYPDPDSVGEESLHRVLFFQYYLNTVSEGGETEFFYQNLKVKPQQGKLVIAPAGFTHTHKGHVPLTDHKYILTSWILFQTAQNIYGKGRDS
ncbi:2OG-Fe(II) oxygenase [Microcoleus sp. ARI1-B5]|uniref:2OG-Fe(II) oxygenase n=1 Tax=unclassified Microcoleus TaxID=2642155 RepID=UPI002FD01F71